MSLTSNLKDKSSPLSRWMDRTFERKLITKLVRKVNDQLNRQTLLLVDTHQEYSLVGTAFDYLFRWQFGPLQKAVAFHGAESLFRQHSNAPAVVRSIIARGDSAAKDIVERSEYAAMLSWFDWVYRSKRVAPELSSALKTQDVDAIIDALRAAIHPGVINDLIVLYQAIPAVWGDDLLLPAVLNPTFAGSADVGGADADWIIGGALYDCKVSKKARPFGRQQVLQGLGYVLLDYNDAFQIKRVGWYYPRHQMRLAYPLEDLLLRLGTEQPLADLRDELRRLLNA